MAKILTIIPYKFYPPQNGGSLRCFYVLREVARTHAVFLLTVQPIADFADSRVPAFPENVTIISLSNSQPYRSVFNIFSKKLGDAINHRILTRSFTSSTNGFFLNAYPLLNRALKEVKPDIVLFENLEVVGLFSHFVRKKLPSAQQIYDAHNVDSDLWGQLANVQGGKQFRKYAENAVRLEKELHKVVDEVWCCSESDEEKLRKLNNDKMQSCLIPNGVDTNENPFDTNNEKVCSKELLFCGNLEYYPNEEGLLWFYNHVFPFLKKLVPSLRLTLVGTEVIKESYKNLTTDPSLNFVGKVPELKPYYNKSSVCIAPILSGSGTRLKILEAMSFGNPIVSTSRGAEGIKAVSGRHLFIANKQEEFCDRIIELLQNKELFENMRTEARNLVQSHYDWQTIGSQIDKALQDC